MNRLNSWVPVISTDSFSMDPEKLSAVLQWLRPMGLRHLQRFLGFANYYLKFIRNFSSLVKPLTDMTRKDGNPQSWSPESIKAFESLKAAFVSAPVLANSDPTLSFILEVEASVSTSYL